MRQGAVDQKIKPLQHEGAVRVEQEGGVGLCLSAGSAICVSLDLAVCKRVSHLWMTKEHIEEQEKLLCVEIPIA